ncbi:MAG: TIGR03364 family FAD-dependent oxidoreductase [Candidatus Pseudobacter hemicellulosilyticus]|uniref:TIGR03364 family FAD-dependent oxidoreductase n=1 Tax=Candidatus Pseudobacter hemicellulosilyticus TaxID=3121375 RepID=A0AAJ6BG11_9BACT|nr:MAG: TIGR03364 family FAD-dependent oxidoreductase [Pseudobacter sp.]
MHPLSSSRAIVIGAGIVGLAAARTLAQAGYQVTVFERNPQAVGASIRNFGMVWPIGQPAHRYATALRSRGIWQQMARATGSWFHEEGSLHLAYDQATLQVLEETASTFDGQRNGRLLTAAEALDRSQAVNPDGLLGAFYSADELIVDPRTAIAATATWLREKQGVQFHWNTVVHRIESGVVCYGDQQRLQADLILVCSGADFETLYPEVFQQAPITKCKLQMMRLVAQPDQWRIGPSLCGGLSLLHYKAFEVARSLPALLEQEQQRRPQYLQWGIHVMVSQQGTGELTIGDSHEYGPNPDPFDRQFINDLILDYLKTFARFKDWRLGQSWNGVYAKMTNGNDHFLHQPQPGVIIFNALGGAGMTLSFGLAEEVLEGLI